MADRLRAAGHQVYAPSLDGCGERKATVRPGITTETQADEVAQLLFYEDLKDVVLVGTSSGGMVVCRVAELMRERVGRIALVDALALLPGEKIGDIVTSSTATQLTPLTRGPTPEDAATRLFADPDFDGDPVSIQVNPIDDEGNATDESTEEVTPTPEDTSDTTIIDTGSDFAGCTSPAGGRASTQYAGRSRS